MESEAPEGLSRIVLGILGNRCPRCFRGRVFAGLVSMPERCPSCGLAYHREPGYYTTAMSFSYAVGGLTIFPIFFGLASYGASVPDLGIDRDPLVLTPLLFRYSRLAWLHVDFAATGDAAPR
jgi:hypothetical protein